MNKDNAAAFLPLVQALAEGKTIQYCSIVDSSWLTVADVSFSLPVNQYRVKPEPEVVTRYVNQGRNYPTDPWKDLGIHTSEAYARCARDLASHYWPQTRTITLVGEVQS